MPGIDGLAIAPMIASVASVALSCSDSNQRSRIGRAGAGEDLDRLARRVAQLPEGAAQREQRPEVAEPGPQQVGRRHGERGLEEVGHPLEHRLVSRVALGVALLNLRDLPAGQLGVRAQHQRAAVGERRERGRVPREHLEAVWREVQIADDRRAEEAVDVGGGRDLEAGQDLLGDARAADDVAPLEHEHAQPGAGEVARGHEPVVPGTDHDGVVTRGVLGHWMEICHARARLAQGEEALASRRS